MKKGKLYWVVLSPQKKSQDTYDVWNNNFAGTQGTFSNNIGSGWNSSYQVLGAFGVFGKRVPVAGPVTFGLTLTRLTCYKTWSCAVGSGT